MLKFLENCIVLWYLNLKGVRIIMNRIFSLILAIILGLTCCACAGKTDSVKNDETAISSEVESESLEDIEMKKYLPEGMEFSKNKVDFIGRFEKTNECYKFAWSGSTIRAGFVGTGIAVKLKSLEIDSKYGASDFLEVIVDGTTQKTIAITKTPKVYTLAEGLEHGYHYVELIKRTEVGKTQMGFYGFDYKGGLEAFAPAQKERTIEFIGDSITAGWGNMSSWQTNEFILSEENATKSYGYLVAKNLNAEAVLTAISGGGIVQNSGGSTPGFLPIYWNSYAHKFNDKKYDFSLSKQPDAVVINIGTNDLSKNFDEQKFVTEYVKFLQDVRKQYPDAYILCTLGPMTVQPYSAIEQAIKELQYMGEDKVSAYEIKVKMDTNEMKGAVGHPSALCHEKMAAEITAVLKEKLGW